MNYKRLTVLSCLFFAACDGAPPKTVCVQSHTELLLMPKRVGDITVTQPQPVVKCIKRAPNPDYQLWIEQQESGE